MTYQLSIFFASSEDWLAKCSKDSRLLVADQKFPIPVNVLTYVAEVATKKRLEFAEEILSEEDYFLHIYSEIIIDDQLRENVLSYGCSY